MKFIRTDAEDADFINLVKSLDAELAERDGKDHPFYAQYNKLHDIKYVVIAFEENTGVACGAIKEFDDSSMEVKRMYTLPDHRAKGIAAKLLGELEKWAIQLNYQRCILETGKKQPEAIQLYKKCGYTKIENYGQYSGVENSECFEKILFNPNVLERQF